MEPVIHQALCYVLYRDARGRFELAQIDDGLVGDEAMLTGVEYRKMGIEAPGQILVW